MKRTRIFRMFSNVVGVALFLGLATTPPPGGREGPPPRLKHKRREEISVKPSTS